MYKEINKESIDELMNVFYTKVRKDKSLSLIFNEAIGEGEEEWEEHIKKIGRFWKQMVGLENNYNGNPMMAHLDLPRFSQDMFPLWLSLFTESIDKVYEDNAGDILFAKAHTVAKMFQSKLY